MKAKAKATHAVIDIVVEARGNYNPFPLDMLRYDNCVPATSEDASNILVSQHCTMSGIQDPSKHIRIHLRRFTASTPAPTFARWHSMGWRVLHHHEMEKHLNGNPMPQYYPDDYSRMDAMPLAKA